MVLRRFLAALAVLGVAILLFGYWEGTSAPLLRTGRFALEGWPAGARPVRIVFVSDLHVASPDMPPDRIRQLTERINRLAPDLVLLGGDFVSDKSLETRRYSIGEAVAPLRALHARLGVIAVLGNHDVWRDAAATRQELTAIGVTVLENQAVQAGPLAIGGLGDDFTGRANLGTTMAQLRPLAGAKILLSHSPDPFAARPDVGLMLAGHTHCGQIVLPLVGPLATMSDYGERYRCGLIRESGRTLIVSAGIGTSILPLRIGAPPDFWLVQVGPK